MVTSVTSLTGNGLKDWLIQRLTAVYFTVYILYVAVYVLFHRPLNYTDWHALFSTPWMLIAYVLAVIAFTLHAWVGVWTVITDYIKPVFLRLLFNSLLLFWLSAQFVWALMIVGR